MTRASKALLFNFSDSWSAALACDTLQQLGYEPVLHEGNRLHIHLESDDLTSALEIVQAHGGELLDESAVGSSLLTDSVYAMDALSIPAHLVNEDWEEAQPAEEPAGLRNRDDDADTAGEFLPDPGEYGFFSGDVRI